MSQGRANQRGVQVCSSQEEMAVLAVPGLSGLNLGSLCLHEINRELGVVWGRRGDFRSDK